MTFDLDDSRIAKARLTSLRQLRRLPGFEELSRINRFIARAQHADTLPSLPAPLADLFDELVRDGIVKVPMKELGVPFEATIEATRRHVEALRSGHGESVGKTSKHVPVADLIATPEPFFFGLQAPILDFVERYFSLPVDFLGVDIKREVANGVEEGVRCWHFDIEDDRMMKLIVYLSDVDEAAGPLEAIRAPWAERFRKEVHHVWGDDYTTARLEKLVPPAEWYKGIGPTSSVHLMDPVRVLHRAGPPTARDRYSMTYSYASKSADFAFSKGRDVQRAFLSRWGALLDERQRHCLTPSSS
jgi:hypothetical protein